MPREEAENVFKRHKRTPIRPPTTKTDFYIKRTTNQTAALKRITKILKEEGRIKLHALGAAINKAVRIAYLCKQENPEAEWDISTSSVNLYDDLEAKDLVNSYLIYRTRSPQYKCA